MQVYILNNSYEFIGVIDEAESILWNKRYNDVGEAEIYIACNESYLQMLKKGYYLYRYDDDMFCKIETIEIETDEENGDYIIATAADISQILSGRIVREKIVFNGTVPAFIKKVLTENVIAPAVTRRKVPNFRIDESNFAELTDTISVSTMAEDILQLVIATCKAYNYGFRVSYDVEAGELVFRLYKGVNKATAEATEYVEFSSEFANILSTSYKDDESNFKNLVYVGYKGTDEQTYLLSLYNEAAEPEGEARREIYVDGTNTSRDISYDELVQMFPTVQRTDPTTDEEGKNYLREYYITESGNRVVVATSVQAIKKEGEEEAEEKITVTDYTYLLLIRIVGQNALAAQTRTQEFSGEVDTLETYEYKTDYNLGDFVFVINDYGIGAPAQITEVMESQDTEDGYQVAPKFEYIN